MIPGDELMMEGTVSIVDADDRGGDDSGRVKKMILSLLNGYIELKEEDEEGVCFSND